MFLILVFTVLGFFVGLIWVILRRKVTLNKALGVLLLGLFLGALKEIIGAVLVRKRVK